MTEASPLQARGGGKRGLAFPKQQGGTAGSQWTHAFEGTNKITWMYDWEAVIDGQPIDLEYVPLLHSNEQWCTEGWLDNIANARKKYKVSHVLSFNEPDQVGGGGTGMDVASAVATHQAFIQPLAAQGLRIGSPAVTNGNEPGKGMEWLKNFVSSCSGCQLDFVVTHYYAWDKAEDFKTYLQKFHATFNKPVWVTEFGVTSGDADEFLRQVLPWMDAQPWIERYAYHMVAPATNTKFLINANGQGLSSTGQVYASA
ncbi:TIR2 Cold shock induced [Pyrenophora seminiperda CCB06]|uniref:TIR2 Cold shock induced n=1 Tax=Pyrenophora seminiperda CCB06 TaxID=1302712 RepID=A0A3M7LWV1_9PLEO|nr:TIR2 Cold shock induced [Pyrenophora seminiperda CCB06]